MAKSLTTIIALLLTSACQPGNPAPPTEGDRDRSDYRLTPAVIHTDRGVQYRDESGRWQAIGKPHGEGYSGGIDGEDAQ